MDADSTLRRDGDLFRLVSGVVCDAGLEVVDVRLSGAGGRRILRVDIDRPGHPGVDIDDCQRVNQQLGLLLEEADLIPGRYVLEVSSPGADRPIRSADDIRRNTGRRVVVTARDAEGNSMSFRGRLLGSEAGCLLLSDDGNDPTRIPLDGIVKAQQELEL